MSFLHEAMRVFTELRPFLGGAFCLLGGILSVVGAIGVLRFPDFYTRLHAASVTDTGAVLSLLLGMALLAPSWAVFIKLVAVGIFLCLTAPTSSHAIANAAHTAGVEPIIGRIGAQPEGGEDS